MVHALNIRPAVTYPVVYVARSESQSRGMVNDLILIDALRALVGRQNIYVRY